jgi:hypothetical protein
MFESEKNWDELLEGAAADAAARAEARQKLDKKVLDWVNNVPTTPNIDNFKVELKTSDVQDLALHLALTYKKDIEFISVIDDILVRSILKKEETFAWKHQIWISFEEMSKREIIFRTLCFRIMILKHAYKILTNREWEPTDLDELPNSVLNAASATYDDAFKIDFDDSYSSLLE